MSLFTSLQNGVSGLNAASSGLNTTSHNLANTKTPGYTRQQNIQKDMYYQTFKVTNNATMKIGYGTYVADVRQIRDMFLDKEYRLQVSRQSFYEKQVECEQEVEDIFGETEGVEFRNSMESIWEAVQNLSTNPENVVNRQLFVAQCESFIETAKNAYNAITKYQTGLNSEVEKQVKAINGIADQIAELNKIISEKEASGLENANDYRDQRNLLMDQLAGYTYYTYNEDVDGKVQIYIGDAPLVIETQSFHMKTESATQTGMYNVVWEDKSFGDVYNTDEAYSKLKKTDTGSLLGILTARGKKNAIYSDIPQKPDASDQKYYNDQGVFQKDAYDADYGKYKDKVELYNNTTGNSILTQAEAQFDRLINGVVTMLNDIFCPNVKDNSGSDKLKINSTVEGTTKDAAGNDITFKLDPSKKYKVLDVVNSAVGADDDQTIGTELFVRTGTPRYTQITLKDQVYSDSYKDADGNPIGLAKDNGDGTFTLYVYNEENVSIEKDTDGKYTYVEHPDDYTDKTTMYTITNIQLNPAILADYSLLPVKANSTGGESGAYALDIYKDILAAWKSDFAVLDPNTETSYTYDEYYHEMIGSFGSKGQVWKSIADDQEKLVESVENKRQQVSGVSTDEELTSLLTYQHAYNAASRYINVVNQMLEHLLERLG
ncbi:flagellar hook-associated protein FlgK [Eubacterium sp. MSJ-13]|uniref:flagellar hook-associated protein FlgK n=1 Tax=Eubacterium sp. MSJ-13 TaxID=2841513 RepID=UPI001C11AA3E|nr:flagellar hook-associated protein FlgK [Eubacterium sp. MSJ-13]MBU5477761.1 flagellar hook-associated protein FlgK [Eubacterium sp. MSJ-13]